MHNGSFAMAVHNEHGGAQRPEPGVRTRRRYRMKKTAVVVDFGTSKIVTLVAESGNYGRCDIIGVGSAEYDGYMEGEWNVPERLDNAIKASLARAEEQYKRRIKEVYVGVPGAFSRVYVVETQVALQGADPRVTPEDVEAIFQKATETLQPVRGAIIHRSPAWFMVDDGKKTMEPVDLKGTALRAMVCFVVAEQFFLNDVSARLSRIGIVARGFFSTPMGEVMHLLTPEERDRIAVLIDVGYLQTEVMASEGDALIFHKTLPIGGAHIMVDLVEGLQAPPDVCEQLKRSYVFSNSDSGAQPPEENIQGRTFTHQEVAEVLEPRVDELAEMIQECIEHSGIHLSNYSNIYLTGGGLLLMNGGRVYLSARLERAVRQAQNRSAKLKSPIYASTLGLADLVFEAQEAPGETQSVTEKIKEFFSQLFAR